MPKFATLAEKLDAYSIPEPNSGCLLWTGGVSGKGYGHAYWEGKDVYGHTETWKEANGPIPPGLQVLHKCDVPSCRYLGHLFLGTPADNMADKVAKGRQPRGKQRSDCKLSDDDVRAVRADRRLRRVIAAEYSVSKTLITEIKLGKRRWWVSDLPAAPLFVGVPTPERPAIPTPHAERSVA